MLTEAFPTFVSKLSSTSLMRKFSLFLMGAMLFGVAALWISVAPTPTPNPNPTPTPTPSGNTITLEPSVKRQTISGLLLEGGAPGGPSSQFYSDFVNSYNRYSTTLWNDEVDQGDTWFQLDIMPSIENNTPGYTAGLGNNEGLRFQQWHYCNPSCIKYEGTYKPIIPVSSSGALTNPITVNNLSGFHFERLDYNINQFLIPLKAKVETSGRTFHIEGNYTAGLPSSLHATDARYYARFALAVYQHMRDTFGFVPERWQIINEPDNLGGPFNPGGMSNGTYMGQVIKATGDLLAANGFHPMFVTPGVMCMGNAVSYLNDTIAVPGALPYIFAVSFHRYCDNSMLAKVASAAAAHGLKTEMTEHANGTADELLTDLIVGNVVLWEQFGGDGLNFDPYCSRNCNSGNSYVYKDLNGAGFRQVFHFVKQGAVRIDANGGGSGLYNSTAFINPDGRYVFVTQASGSQSFTVTGLPAGTYGIEYTTSGQFNHDVADVTISSGQSVAASIPAAGVITVYAK